MQLASSVSAATFHTITLAWDPVSDAEIAGYKVYIGTESQLYTEVLDAGMNAELSVPNMEFGETYYIAVTAVGSGGLESPYSEEIIVTVSPPPLPAGGGISMNDLGQPELHWSFAASALNSAPEFIIQASSDLLTWTTVDTVFPEQSTGGDGETLQFSWLLPMSGPQRFYRLTAENWVGGSTGP